MCNYDKIFWLLASRIISFPLNIGLDNINDKVYSSAFDNN